MSSNIKLQSSDGVIFDVDIEVAKMSMTIKTMLEDLGPESNDDEPIPLPNVRSKVLKKVIDWATYHKNNPQETFEDDNEKDKCVDDIEPWDMEFLNLANSEIFAIILAANYLDVKGLLDAACKTVANMMRGKSADEIRDRFEIPKECVSNVNEIDNETKDSNELKATDKTDDLTMDVKATDEIDNET